VNITQDGCYAEVVRAAAGGFCHDLCWLLVVEEADRPSLSIPIIALFMFSCGETCGVGGVARQWAETGRAVDSLGCIVRPGV
jgi:hypothetical protein